MTRGHSLCVEASSSPISCTCAESVSTASMVSRWHALFVSLKGCNRFLPIRIAGSNESKIFLYWLKISFQIQLSCIHNKMLNLAKRHNEASNKSRTCTPLRTKRSPILPLCTKATLWQFEVLWGMKLHRRTIDCR